jgi:predicted ester cyclase
MSTDTMLVTALRRAFPDLAVRIDEVIADEETVVARKICAGTHRGDFMGLAPTGRPITFELTDILTLRHGFVAEHRVLFDEVGLRRQLG